MPETAVHPGEVLKEERDERGVSPTGPARRIDVPASHVSQIVAGKRTVTADTALRLAHRFGTDPRFRMNLQARFDPVAAERPAVTSPAVTAPAG